MHNQIDTAKEEEEGPSFVSPHQILPMDNVIHDKFFTTRNQNSDDKKKITNKCRKDSMTRQEVCGLSVPQFWYVKCETNFKKKKRFSESEEEAFATSAPSRVWWTTESIRSARLPNIYLSLYSLSRVKQHM